ncbi:MAG: hypothetical protein LBB11_03785 [Puniceicoccales bacterium]|jgi:hypothetical protein|nr:hypothetical protein [Puniceicoccales bacterium]
MIEGGDKAEFASSVCEAMAILYRSNIEENMPDEIKIQDGTANDKAFKDDTRIMVGEDRTTCGQMRNAVNVQLREVMENNGGNYFIMYRYLKNQLFINSPENKCPQNHSQVLAAMQYFMSQQRQDPNEERYLSADNTQTKEDAMKKYCEAYNQELKDTSTNPKVYAKTVAMYKAFTAAYILVLVFLSEKNILLLHYG